MVHKILKKVDEKSVLFLVFILLAVLVLGSLFVMKPKMTGFATEGGEAPVITLVGDSEITIEVGMSYVDEGATALDVVDGNLTSDIVIVNPVDTNTLGVYTITYDVTDSVGNDAIQVTRNVTVVDSKPIITLVGDPEITIEVGMSYSDEGATATDVVDGNLTSDIVIVNPVDTNTLGVYTITYNVNDSFENPATQVTRNVTVVDSKPIITLVGDPEITIEVGMSYVDEGATATDVVDGNLTSDIVIVNPVDTNTLGVYTITYNVNDSVGNDAVQVTRTVNVIATCAPDTCGSLNYNCGSLDDGCGETLNCGTCDSGYSCVSGVCEEETSSEDTTTSGGETESSNETNGEIGIPIPSITGVVTEPVCSPDWECGEWTECVGEVQTRECKDTNACGLAEGKPESSQSCQMPETCSDGIKNQDEGGIDCGGVCEKKCSLFTIMGNAVNVPINSSKQFIEDNKIVSFSILGFIALIIVWIIIVKVFLKKKRIFFFLGKRKKLSSDNANT